MPHRWDVAAARLARRCRSSRTRAAMRRSPAQAPAARAIAEFPAFVEGLRAEALARGISEATVERALTGLEPSPTVIERDQIAGRDRAHRSINTSARGSRAPFVRTGAQMATRHRGAAQARRRRSTACRRASSSPIWGLESNFGRFSGVRPTIQALATLAWEGRRGAFFRGELMDALEIVDRGYIGLDALRGSWAGAMGQTAVHAVELSEMGAGFRRRRRPRHLALAARHLRVDRQLPEGARLVGRHDVGPRGAAAGRRRSRRFARRRACAPKGCRAEREMTDRAAAREVAGARRAHGHGRARCRRRRSTRR